jgi:hypothetical protein
MNQMELTPNYAGTLRGFTNTFGNITGFVAPLIAGAITTNNVSLTFTKDMMSKELVMFQIGLKLCFVIFNMKEQVSLFELY